MGQLHRLAGATRWFAALLMLGAAAALSSAAAADDNRGKMNGNGSRPHAADEHYGPYRCAGLDRSGLHNRRVHAAMSRVARHAFVPEDVRENAYADMALPIGHGQTISQPYIVGLMSQEADAGPNQKVLEIGTGSGYQAAVLAELGARVFSIEIIPELAKEAQETLHSQGYDGRVSVRHGDGFAGWPEEAPFDAILVTAASPGYPPALLRQLADNGRMIIPIENGSLIGETLVRVQRKGDEFFPQDLGPVRFVPLTGDVRSRKSELPQSLRKSFRLSELNKQ